MHREKNHVHDRYDRFARKTQIDEAFVTGLVDAIGDAEGDVAINAVVIYATNNGFEITVEDAAEAQKQIVAYMDQTEGDLVDDELDNVAGGILPILGTAAIGGAVMAAGPLLQTITGRTGGGAVGGAVMAVSGATRSAFLGAFKKW